MKSNHPVVIGIAGGSGAGKTCLSFSLLDKYPELFSIIHFDDYNKKRSEIPETHGFKNFDTPEAIDFDKLVVDLQTLIKGGSITIGTKNERDNPQYDVTLVRKEKIITPKPYIILEGYLVLHDSRIRKMITASFFLDVSDEIRMSRRTKFIDDLYTEKILIPMHQMYVEPTKEYADHILDMNSSPVEKTLEKIVTILQIEES